MHQYELFWSFLFGLGFFVLVEFFFVVVFANLFFLSALVPGSVIGMFNFHL